MRWIRGRLRPIKKGSWTDCRQDFDKIRRTVVKTTEKGIMIVMEVEVEVWSGILRSVVIVD